jgi:hypothetical protein
MWPPLRTTLHKIKWSTTPWLKTSSCKCTSRRSKTKWTTWPTCRKWDSLRSSLTSDHRLPSSLYQGRITRRPSLSMSRNSGHLIWFKGPEWIPWCRKVFHLIITKKLLVTVIYNRHRIKLCKKLRCLVQRALEIKIRTNISLLLWREGRRCRKLVGTLISTRCWRAKSFLSPRGTKWSRMGGLTVL